MANRLVDKYRIDVPIVATSVSNTTATGRYAPMAYCKRALFALSVGAMAASKTVKLEIFQGTTEAGGSGEAITSLTATITANTKVKKATVALASVGTGDTVTVTSYLGGVLADTAVFTKGGTSAALVFADTAGLTAAILANIDGVSTATSTTNTIITALNDYTVTVVSADVGGTVTVATNEAIVIVEVEEMDLDSTFFYVAPKVTSTANGYVQVSAIYEMKNLETPQGNAGARYPTT